MYAKKLAGKEGVCQECRARNSVAAFSPERRFSTGRQAPAVSPPQCGSGSQPALDLPRPHIGSLAVRLREEPFPRVARCDAPRL